MTEFFLGKDLNEGKNVFIKADSFTTHAFVLGMTGSGKTGLLISILEECALNDIPAVIIDPKGDLTNRLLIFKELDRDVLSNFIPEEKLDHYILKYEEGLKSLGYNEEKINSLLKRKIKIFTPGLNLSPINILERFSCRSLIDESEILERANSIVSSLLSLTKSKSDDSVSSPEGLLLSSIFIEFWKKGESLSLDTLLQTIVNPPFSQLGILPIETVIPKDKRISLAVELNGILSSPAMTFFKRGDELDFDKLFSDFKNETIFTLSQLSDEQRDFFLGVFLSELYGWVRKQSGSDRLKMVFIFDEVFGFFPPYPKNPPTKQPLMGLLKQARAFGFSVILATQNPYDVDYKGLTNAGLWFIGRLQTQNDIERVKEGLSTITGGEQAISMLSSLKPREFVLNDVRKEKPILFKTRNCISHLVGPLSENQLRNFMEKDEKKEPLPKAHNIIITPKEIKTLYLQGESLSPFLLFEVEIPYKVNKDLFCYQKTFISKIKEEGISSTLSSLKEVDLSQINLSENKPLNCEISPLPQWSISLKKESLEKEIKEVVSLKCSVEIFSDPFTKLSSKIGESLENFLLKIKEKRDLQIEKKIQKEHEPILKKKRAKEIELERSQIKLERLKSEYEKRKAETYTTAGVGILRGIFGSKRSILSGISTTMTKERMAESSKSKYEEEKVVNEKIRAEISELNNLIENLKIKNKTEIDPSEIEKTKIFPLKNGIRVLSLSILYKNENQ